MSARLRSVVVLLAASAACADPATVIPRVASRVASVEVSGPTTIVVHDSARFKAVAKDGGGTPLTDRAATWNSDNVALATVDQAGMVTGLAIGTATISATIEGVTRGVALTVLLQPFASCRPDVPAADPGCNLTHDPGEQTFPAISGNRVVWASRPISGLQAIIMYDLTTDQYTQITPAGTENLLPVVDGNRIVYARLPAVGDWELYSYDVPTHTETLFSTISRDVGLGRFSMSGDRVVWHTRRNGNWDIFLYDFATRSETRITTDAADQADPSIHGDIIAWWDRRNGATWADVYMYDLTTHTEQRITQNSTLGRGPVVTADRIVWGDTRNGFFTLYEYRLRDLPHERQVVTSRIENDLASFGPYVAWVNRNDANPVFYDDVFVYNFDTSTEVRLTRLPARQWRPALSAGYVLWEDNRNGNADIYVARLADLIF